MGATTSSNSTIINTKKRHLEDDNTTQHQSNGLRMNMSSSNGPRISSSNNRNDCISTLRQLCKEGKIEKRMKNELLSTIADCRTEGRVSSVETAFKMLYMTNTNYSENDCDEEFIHICEKEYRKLVTK